MVTRFVQWLRRETNWLQKQKLRGAKVADFLKRMKVVLSESHELSIGFSTSPFTGAQIVLRTC